VANTSKAIKPKFNLYDISNNIEADLFEGYIVEFTDIAGIEFDYYIRDEDVTETDILYGEPLYQNTMYSSSHRSKFIYEPTEEATLTTPFGINSEEMIQFALIPKFTFSRDVSGYGYHPKPGDVVTTIWNNRSYEVVDVGEEEKIFQLSKLIWEFILKPYRFSEQSQSARDIALFSRAPTDIVESQPISGYGDNVYIEEQSNLLDTYADVDTGIYGY
jgi:hypothetical protein